MAQTKPKKNDWFEVQSVLIAFFIIYSSVGQVQAIEYSILAGFGLIESQYLRAKCANNSISSALQITIQCIHNGCGLSE